MKRIVSIITVIVGLWLMPVNSQAGIFDNPDKGMTAEMGLGISRVSEYTVGVPYEELHKTGVIYIPRLSYRFNSNWSAGIIFRYDSNNFDSYKSYGAFAELSFLKIRSCWLRVFTDLHYLYNHSDIRNFTEIGLVPGIALNIPGSPIDIKLRYLFIGFNDGYYRHKDVGGCLGRRGDWILDAGLRRLELGVAVNF